MWNLWMCIIWCGMYKGVSFEHYAWNLHFKTPNFSFSLPYTAHIHHTKDRTDVSWTPPPLSFTLPLTPPLGEWAYPPPMEKSKSCVSWRFFNTGIATCLSHHQGPIQLVRLFFSFKYQHRICIVWVADICISWVAENNIMHQTAPINIFVFSF